MLALRQLEGFTLRKIEGLALSNGEGFAPGFFLVSAPPPSARVLKSPKSNHSRTYANFSRKSNCSRTYAYPRGEGMLQSHFPTAPTTLLFPLHTRIPPATPFFPLLTQKQGVAPGRSEESV
jgi:hypothetical protein